MTDDYGAWQREGVRILAHGLGGTLMSAAFALLFSALFAHVHLVILGIGAAVVFVGYGLFFLGIAIHSAWLLIAVHFGWVS